MTTLPQYPEDEALDAILARMLAAIPGDYDKAEGSPLYSQLAAVAAELAQLVVKAQLVLERGFAQTTFGQYLTLRAEEHGTIRRASVAATGTVTFTGTVGTVIPAGTVVSTGSTATVPAILFTTDEEATVGVGGTVDVAVTASEAGTSGNVAAGAVTFLAAPMAGVSGVNNAAPFTGGTAEESDASLLNRYLTRVRTPGTSGNKADYINWALEVAGVGAAQCIPIWDGPGTVKVVIIDTDKLPASVDLVADVQEYIAPEPALGEGKAPIGPDVTVVAATGVAINVIATVVLDGTKTLSEVQTVFTSTLTQYLKDIAFTDDPGVKYARVGSMLLDTEGVQDYNTATFTINGGTGNVTINQAEVATLGTVTLSE